MKANLAGWAERRGVANATCGIMMSVIISSGFKSQGSGSALCRASPGRRRRCGYRVQLCLHCRWYHCVEIGSVTMAVGGVNAAMDNKVVLYLLLGLWLILIRDKRLMIMER